MRWFLVVAVLLLLWVYVRFTYKTPSKVVILQSSLADFHLKMLLDKQPIVIQDRVDNIMPVWNGWFKYNYRKSFELTPEMEWARNRYKYMLIHGKEDGEVMLCHPNCKKTKGVPDMSEEIVAIKLYKGMSIIVPYRWHIAVSMTEHAMGVHDLFTYVLPA